MHCLLLVLGCRTWVSLSASTRGRFSEIGHNHTDRVSYKVVGHSASCSRRGVISPLMASESMQRSGTTGATSIGDEAAGVGSIGETGGRLLDGDMSSQDLNRY